jgi:DNA polymerase elongation subunit (family B)
MLLRDKILIDKIKKDLKKYQKLKDFKNLYKLQLKASKTILNSIFDYPYQSNHNDYGSILNKILIHKEISCL